MAPVKVTDANFDTDVLGADEPVVVDFWAEWCGPCRLIAPALEEIATEMDGKVTIAKLNVDENPDIMMRYGVRSIPTLIMFKNGEPTAMQVGAMPKQPPVRLDQRSRSDRRCSTHSARGPRAIRGPFRCRARVCNGKEQSCRLITRRRCSRVCLEGRTMKYTTTADDQRADSA